jgi:hypothetical protein
MTTCSTLKEHREPETIKPKTTDDVGSVNMLDKTKVTNYIFDIQALGVINQDLIDGLIKADMNGDGKLCLEYIAVMHNMKKYWRFNMGVTADKLTLTLDAIQGYYIEAYGVSLDVKPIKTNSEKRYVRVTREEISKYMIDLSKLKVLNPDLVAGLIKADMNGDDKLCLAYLDVMDDVYSKLHRMMLSNEGQSRLKLTSIRFYYMEKNGIPLPEQYLKAKEASLKKRYALYQKKQAQLINKSKPIKKMGKVIRDDKSKGVV